MVAETEATEREAREERKRKRIERLQNYDQTSEATETRRKFIPPESSETVEVRVEEKPTQERPKVEVKSGSKTRAPTKEEIGTVAPLLLNSLNTLVVVNFGNEAGMTQNEAAVIAPSLQRCLERLPASTAKRAGVFLDPLVLLIGISLWGKRIVELQDRKAKEKYQVQPTEIARANGVSGYEYQVPHTATVTNGAGATNPYVNTAPNRSEPEPVSPPYSTANGVPDAIRNAERDY